MSPAPIMSSDTTVSVEKTVGEIHSLLCQAGADYISTRFDASRTPDAISFCIQVQLPGGPLRAPMNFVLPARWEGVLKRLGKPRVPTYSPVYERAMKKREEQARRVAWRNVYFWLKAQLSIIECEQAEVVEVFLPYAVSRDGATTLFQQLKQTSYAGLLPERAGAA